MYGARRPTTTGLRQLAGQRLDCPPSRLAACGGALRQRDRIPVQGREHRRHHPATAEPDGSEVLTQTLRCRGTLPERPRLGMVIRLPRPTNSCNGMAAVSGTATPTASRPPTSGGGRAPSPRSTPIIRARAGQRQPRRLLAGHPPHTPAGRTLRVEAVDAPFSFEALHYAPQTLFGTRYDDQLHEDDATFLHIDCAVLGLGNSSCGPGVLRIYSIDKQRKHTSRCA